jgi:hypothetical protein
MAGTILLGAIGAVAPALGLAADVGYTVRPTELKDQPFGDAAGVAQLAQNTRVDLMERQSTWVQVKAPTAKGWVRMLSLRFDPPGKGTSASPLGALFNVSEAGRGSSVATTGVKGITEDGLRNASPNPGALRQVGQYQASRDEARSFAEGAGLQAQPLDYVNGTSAKGGAQ